MNEKRRVNILMFLTCLMFGINAAMTLLTTKGISNVMLCAEMGTLNLVVRNIIVCLLIVVGEKVSAVFMAWVNLMYLNAGDLSVRNRIISSILRRPIRLFRIKEDAYYINLLTNDMGMYRSGCLGNYPWVVFFAVYSLMSFGLLLQTSWMLAIVTLILSGLPFLADKFFAGLVQKYKDKTSKDSQAYLCNIKEIIEGIEEIKHDNKVELFEERAYCASKNMRDSDAKRSFAESLSQEALYASASIIRLAVLFIGTYQIFEGKMKVATLYAALNYSVALSNSFSNISNYHIQIKSTKEIKKRLFDESKLHKNSFSKGKVCFDDYNIVISDLSFSFEDRQIYENFSYCFEAGKKYVILGESGSGKTTLIKLMQGYYSNYTGSIKIGGLDLRDVSEESLYDVMSVVSQDSWLMNATLYDNVTMLTETPNKNSEAYFKLLELVKLGNLSERVGDRPLGDFGDSISGGEKQRVCLARAIRRKTPIMIFDEPTTGLDQENKEIVQNTILNLSGVTRIVITHDYSEDYLSKFDGVIRIGK